MSDYRFGNNKKLLSKSEYSAVFASRNIIHGKYFNLLYQNTSGSAKLGLAIAKKHHKLAVVRNNLKRIVRETFRTSDIASYNIVVLSKHFKNIENKALFKDVNVLFSKLK